MIAEKPLKEGEGCIHICRSHKYNNLDSYKEKLCQILMTCQPFEGQGAAGIQKAFICTKSWQKSTGAQRTHDPIDTCTRSGKGFKIEKDRGIAIKDFKEKWV